MSKHNLKHLNLDETFAKKSRNEANVTLPAPPIDAADMGPEPGNQQEESSL